MELTRTLLGLLCFSVLRFTNQQEISGEVVLSLFVYLFIPFQLPPQ